jgi:predicted secreted Zn-dependent protease
LLSGEHGVALAADPDGASDAQATAAMPAAVQVSAAATFYDVEGTDVRSLLASLRQRGPSDGQGTGAASTSWVFRWSYQPALDSACRVQAAHVNLELAYTYPQWNAAASAAPSVANAWQGYLARDELHEHGHRDIAEVAATDLARALEALPAQSSCDALADAARATATDLLARHAQAQAAYDRETGHGAPQGAVLHE